MDSKRIMDILIKLQNGHQARNVWIILDEIIRSHPRKIDGGLRKHDPALLF
jgi:predicted metallopeptidase